MSIRLGLLAGLGTDRAREVAQAVHQAREACGGTIVEGDPRAERIGSRQRPHTGIHHADISTRTSPSRTSPRGRCPSTSSESRPARCIMPLLLSVDDCVADRSRSLWDVRRIPVRPLRATSHHPLEPKPRPRRECNVRGSRFREVLQKFFTRKITCQISSIDRRRAVADAPESGHGRAMDRCRPTFRSLRRLRRRATDGHPRDFEGSSRSLHSGMEEDIDDPRRSLPSKADVRCSAVSVGFAVGRLTGTRGTSKARVDHSIVGSGRTSRIHVDLFHRPGVVCSSLPTTLGARQSPGGAADGD